MCLEDGILHEVECFFGLFEDGDGVEGDFKDASCGFGPGGGEDAGEFVDEAGGCPIAHRGEMLCGGDGAVDQTAEGEGIAAPVFLEDFVPIEFDQGGHFFIEGVNQKGELHVGILRRVWMGADQNDGERQAGGR